MAQQFDKNKGGGGYQQNNPPANYGKFESKWIAEKINMDCIDFTEKFGAYLAKNGLTTSQIRNVYGEVKRIQLQGIDKEETAFLLIKPKIAYAVARVIKSLRNNQEREKEAMLNFQKEMNNAHSATQKEGNTDIDSFKRFCEFFEAILAYHKAAGGN